MSPVPPCDEFKDWEKGKKGKATRGNTWAAFFVGVELVGKSKQLAGRSEQLAKFESVASY